jgi:hypothetical protein
MVGLVRTCKATTEILSIAQNDALVKGVRSAACGGLGLDACGLSSSMSAERFVLCCSRRLIPLLL